MNLRDLQYLVALADHLHFGRAAAEVFVSQPTLSTQIRKLERELGVALVERNSRNVVMTSAGERIVEHARSILQGEQTIRAIAQRAQDPTAGTIRLAMFPTIAPYLLPHAIGPIRTQFPALELLLAEEKSAAIVHGLRSGAFDAGILALPLASNTFECIELFSEPFLLAVPIAHPLAQVSGAVDANMLGGEALLLLEDGHCLRDQALELCAHIGATEHNGFRATSLETLRHMVGAGVGITLMPWLSVAPPVASNPAIALIPFTAPTPSRRLGLVWRRGSVYADLFETLAQTITRSVDATMRAASEMAPSQRSQ
jgi:LysR family hydrogen peroxide-inducible transcriptional activator